MMKHLKLPFASHEEPSENFDPERYTPVIRCSICTGEQVAGFKDKTTGRVRDVMLLHGEKDLQAFRKRYGITEPIEKVY